MSGGTTAQRLHRRYNIHSMTARTQPERNASNKKSTPPPDKTAPQPNLPVRAPRSSNSWAVFFGERRDQPTLPPLPSPSSPSTVFLSPPNLHRATFPTISPSVRLVSPCLSRPGGPGRLYRRRLASADLRPQQRIETLPATSARGFERRVGKRRVARGIVL